MRRTLVIVVLALLGVLAAPVVAPATARKDDKATKTDGKKGPKADGKPAYAVA